MRLQLELGQIMTGEGEVKTGIIMCSIPEDCRRMILKIQRNSQASGFRESAKTNMGGVN